MYGIVFLLTFRKLFWFTVVSCPCLSSPSSPGPRVMHFGSALFTSSMSHSLYPFSLQPCFPLRYLVLSCSCQFLLYFCCDIFFFYIIFPVAVIWFLRLSYSLSHFNFTHYTFLLFDIYFITSSGSFWNQVIGLTCLFLIHFYCYNDIILFFLLFYLKIIWSKIWCWISFDGHFYVKLVVCSCRVSPVWLWPLWGVSFFV